MSSRAEEERNEGEGKRKMVNVSKREKKARS